jgi:hypothetical protein
MKQWVILAVVLAGLGLQTPLARAQCSWQPPDELATAPADGQEDVPLDAALYVLTGVGPTPVVEWDDGVVAGTSAGPGWTRFELPGLGTFEEVTYRVVFPAGDELTSDVEYGPYSFRTGNLTSQTPLSPAPGTLSLSDGGGCAELLEAAQCVPDGEWTYAFANVDAPAGTALWRVRVPSAVTLGEFWLPATCPPGAIVAVTGSESPCIEVTAVGYRGSESTSTTFCGGGSDFWGDLVGGGGGGVGGGGIANPDPGTAPATQGSDRNDGVLGCAASGGGGASAWGWLALLAGGLWFRRARN